VAYDALLITVAGYECKSVVEVRFAVSFGGESRTTG
jgi:hypothetical protein